jgi:hypothetical protein
MAQAFHPQIPRAWDDREVEGFEVPLAQPDRSARYLSAAEYYALEVTSIYRSYPVYAPAREPAGYMESLMEKEPEIVFDPAKLRTPEDWIRAGAIVFRSARLYRPIENLARNPDAIRSLQIPAAREGIMPFFQYVVRNKGVVELGVAACANCHTRVLADGTAVEGGPRELSVGGT